MESTVGHGRRRHAARRLTALIAATALAASGCSLVKDLTDGDPLVPDGSDVVTRLGPAGGTVVSEDETASVTFAAGSAKRSVAVKVLPVDHVLEPLDTAVFSFEMLQLVEVRHSAELPAGEIRVRFDPALTADYEDLRIGVEEPDGWLLLDTAADAGTGVLTAKSPHFSRTAVFGLPKKAWDFGWEQTRNALFGAPREPRCQPQHPDVKVRSGKGQIVAALTGCAQTAERNFDIILANRANHAMRVDKNEFAEDRWGLGVVQQPDLLDVGLQVAYIGLDKTLVPASGTARMKIAAGAPAHMTMRAEPDLIPTVLHAAMFGTAVGALGKGAMTAPLKADGAEEAFDILYVSLEIYRVQSANGRTVAEGYKATIESVVTDPRVREQVKNTDSSSVAAIAAYAALIFEVGKCGHKVVQQILGLGPEQALAPSPAAATKIPALVSPYGDCVALIIGRLQKAQPKLFPAGVELIKGAIGGAIRDLLYATSAMPAILSPVELDTEVRIDRPGVVTHPFCDRSTHERPPVFTISCAPGQVNEIRDIVWTEYGVTRAVGHGVYMAGRVGSPPLAMDVEIRLSDPAVNGNLDTYFRDITIADQHSETRKTGGVNPNGSREFVNSDSSFLITGLNHNQCVGVAPPVATRPPVIATGCHAEYSVNDIKWTKWGTLQAEGSGTYGDTGQPVAVRTVGRVHHPGKGAYFRYLVLDGGGERSDCDWMENREGLVDMFCTSAVAQWLYNEHDRRPRALDPPDARLEAMRASPACVVDDLVVDTMRMCGVSENDAVALILALRR